METLLKDIRYGLRGLLRQPGFTLVTIVTLALGIGANTVIFSVVYSVVLKPLPFYRPDRIVVFWGDDRTEGDNRSQVSHTDIADYRAQQTLFESIATFNGWTPLISGMGQPARIGAVLVGDDFFRVLGAKPLLGRVFLLEEQIDGKDQVVVLSHELWRSQFNSDPNVLGKTVLLNLRPHAIVGVVSADLHSLPATLIEKPALLYRPAAETASEEMRSARHLRAIGRLKDGVTLSQAQAELNVIAQRLESQHPEADTNWGIHLVGLQADTVRELQRALWLLLGAVAFVLLIACANVANLLLARGTLRSTEMSIRTALGASRWRLLRQALTESGLLAFAGAALGLLLAVWGVDAVKALAGKMLPQLEAVTLSLPALGFTLALCVLTGLLFGLVPAIQSSRPDLNEALKADGRSFSAGIYRNRLRNALVVSEIAFALVLLMCAGLLVRSFARLQDVNPGFDASHSLKMDLGLPSLRYSTDEKRIAFYRELVNRVKVLPGVTNAAVVTPLPSSSGFDTTGFEVEGQPAQIGSGPMADRYVVDPSYLRALNVPLQRGRELNEQDSEKALPVMLVSQSLAERYWPNQDPIGKRIRMPWNPGRDDKPWRTVVGVVSDVKQYGPDKPSNMALYFPLAQHPVSFMTLVARTSGDPAASIGAVRQVVQTLDPDQVPTDPATMEQVMSDSIQMRRFSMLLLGAFAALALSLAAIGIYGVMSYVMAQRTHEIGIRIALGASKSDVLSLVIKSALVLALSGITIGSFGVFGLTRLMKSLLFGVAPTDVTTFLVVCLGLVGVALLACYLPARRASEVDPLVALRMK
jgi:putative ABC transport system permease protein